MQSFLQYRRLGDRVRRDHEQHNAADQTTLPATQIGVNDKRKETKALVVHFHGDDDPDLPVNWSKGRKWLYTCILGLSGFVVSGASAFSSSNTPQAMGYFDISQQLALLTTALFLVALGLGSLVSAPFSETVGRNPVYLTCLTIFGLFEVGAALSTTIGAQATCRFFAALFGCPPLTTFGGSMSDMWHPIDRTYVFPLLSCFWFVGPFMAPVVGAFVATNPTLGFKWTDWLTAILVAANTLAVFLLVPETYSPILLSWKASHLRRITGHKDHKAEIQLRQTSLVRRLLTSIARPIHFLLTEPIIDLFALYLIIIYIILFGFLPGFDFIFGTEGIYGFDQQHVGLCFIPINIGYLLALIPIYPIHRRFKRKLSEAKQKGQESVPPEERLLFSLLGAPFLPISIFWMGWTAWPSVTFWSPLIGSLLFGFAVMCIFISCYQYMIDCYGSFAASALAVLTVTRYFAAGPMVIVSVPMYARLGVHWSMTLLGCLSLVMTPVPYVFYKYGESIRREGSKRAADRGHN